MKIKMLLVLILSIIICVCLVGCNDRFVQDISHPQSLESSFCLVSTERLNDNETIYIIYHRETKIMYMITALYSAKGCGTSTIIMLDENGKPLLYQGELYANS